MASLRDDRVLVRFGDGLVHRYSCPGPWLASPRAFVRAYRFVVVPAKCCVDWLLVRPARWFRGPRNRAARARARLPARVRLRVRCEQLPCRAIASPRSPAVGLGRGVVPQRVPPGHSSILQCPSDSSNECDGVEWE